MCCKAEKNGNLEELKSIKLTMDKLVKMMSCCCGGKWLVPTMCQ